MELVFLSGFVETLQEILGVIFDEVLAPVLRDVFNILVKFVGEMIHDILSNFLLRLWLTFLKLVDFMEQIFNVFSGISPVKITEPGTDVGKSMSLIEYFFTLSTIQKAFLAITLMAVALAFLTTLFSILKSVADSAFDNKQPISFALKNAGKAALSFLVIPMTCLFFLMMTTKLIAVFNTTVLNEVPGSSVSSTIFMTVAQPAAKADTKLNDYIKAENYQNPDKVKEDFDFKKFDYIQAYTSAILIAMIMLGSILQFIQRIIMIILLYLASPFFVAAIPLDGGKKFKEWRNTFTAHMLSAFGPILAMKLYLLMVPWVANGAINFNVGTDSYLNSCIKLIFIIGGAYAVYKSRFLIVSVINPMTANSMMQTGFLASMVGGAVMGKVKMAAGMAKGMTSSFGGGGGSSGGGGNSDQALAHEMEKKQAAQNSSGQQYTGK